MPFAQFCKEISGKKIKIETLRLQKDSDSACIQNIYVYYKVKGKIFWKKG
jgi:PKD domain containing protein